ncbi:MAG: hypothetical protein P1V18_00045 [Candidatus Gracilibacteria bacterium]|nr:hypothetical protein [Candidatus Gracilibacteria bacterium]
MSHSQRPWQGTALALAAYAMTAYQLFVAFTIGSVSSLLGFGAGEMISATEGNEAVGAAVTSIFAGLGIIGALMILIGALFTFFIGKGYWDGKHWPITFTLIVGGIALFFGLIGMDPATILIMGTPVVLAFTIRKHAFYKTS